MFDVPKLWVITSKVSVVANVKELKCTLATCLRVSDVVEVALTVPSPNNSSTGKRVPDVSIPKEVFAEVLLNVLSMLNNVVELAS